MLKYIIYLLVFIPYLYPQQDPEIIITIDKTIFQIGESVIVGVSLLNNNNNVIIGERYFEISRNDSIQPYKGIIGHEQVNETLQSNSKSYSIEELNRLFGYQPAPRMPAHYFLEGNYRVKLFFKYNDAFIFSNVLDFIVVEPEGDELNVYNTFLGLLRTSTDLEMLLVQLDTLYQNHPNSVYSPQIIQYLEIVYKFHYDDKQKCSELYRILIENYSCSYFTHLLYQSLSKNESERLGNLHYLKNNCTSQVMNKYYENEINNLGEK